MAFFDSIMNNTTVVTINPTIWKQGWKHCKHQWIYEQLLMPNMVNQGTGPLPNLKVLLMEASSFHGWLTLLLMTPTVLCFLLLHGQCSLDCHLLILHLVILCLLFYKPRWVPGTGVVGDHSAWEGLCYTTHRSAPASATLYGVAKNMFPDLREVQNKR